MHHVSIPRRFRGPTSSGNGGWTAGRLAAFLVADAALPLPPVEVTLRTPPPLERELTATLHEGVASLSDGDSLVASARLLDHATRPVPVAAVSTATAQAARSSYAGAVSPFPECFTCGLDRTEGDGLRLFTGPVAAGTDDHRVACDWTPDPSQADPDDPTRVALPVVWAALDCPGAWTIDLADRAVVLGRITASVDALPLVGEPHVVVGDLRGNDGRKWFTAATIHDDDGRVVAQAEHTWIEIDPETFA